jgi:predicted dehydrogenase
MKSRRDFMKDVGKGILSTIIVTSVSNSNTNAQTSKESQINIKKNIRIGIIGAENSHTIGYGRIFNVDKSFPGVELLYVWGETDEFAKDASKRGSIANIVKDPIEMMGKIDALIVDHRHAKYHLEPALPFVKAGIPTFIDKPFCYRVAEGKEFLKIAEELKTPVSSYSTIAQDNGVFDIKAQIPNIGKIYHIISVGPCDVDSKWGGVFFYGVHSIERLMYIFGDDVVEVKVTRSGDKTTAALVFSSGYFATVMFIKEDYRGWDLMVLTNDGMKNLEPRIKNTDTLKPYRDMVEMFKTGKEPRSHKSILAGMAVLEALEKSVVTQQWEKVVI